MKKTTKTILIVSACFMGAGILAAAAGVAAGGWFGLQITRDGIRSSSSGSEPCRLEKTKLDEFTSIKIDIGSEADIEFVPSDDGHCYLEYTLNGNDAEPVWNIAGSTFTLKQNGVMATGLFFAGSDFSWNSGPVIRLYIPDGASFSDIDINNDYGNIDLNSLSADTLTLNLDSGDLDMENLTAGTADIYLDYGDLDMNGCHFTDAEIETDSGSIEAEDTVADTLLLTNNYGDSTLKNTTLRSADLTVESGDLYLEADELETLTGVNEYGDTTFVLRDAVENYTFDLLTEYGEISFSGDVPGRLISQDGSEMSYTSEADGSKKIEFTAESGDIKIQTK